MRQQVSHTVDIVATLVSVAPDEAFEERAEHGVV